MAALTDTIDLGKLGLAPGGAKHFDVRVGVDKFVFGDQDYLLGENPTEVGLDVTRTMTGNVIRVRLSTTINGPCMRCFSELSLPIEVDHSEVHEPRIEDELASEYVDGLELDVAGLVRDAIGLALPATIASPVDDDGICTLCPGAADQLAKLGESVDEVEQAQPDPRWAKLRELEL